jgi:hypothetical protein
MAYAFMTPAIGYLMIYYTHVECLGLAAMIANMTGLVTSIE